LVVPYLPPLISAMNKLDLIKKIKSLDGITQDERAYLINLINTKKKYGLVWEDKPEDVEELLRENLPVLKEISDKAITSSAKYPNHILIECDNLHALTVLTYTHEGKVDVMYFDPPYNTGSTDWKYNNDYVIKEDSFKHSKWLSFMNKRLTIAKRLLSSRGVLICTIDENEHATLGLLLQELFSEYEITLVTIIHNPSGIQGKNFSYNNEFAYFVYPKGERAISLESRSIDQADIRGFMNGAKGNTKNYLRETGYNCFYPIIIKDNKIIKIGDVTPKENSPGSPNIDIGDGCIEVYPIDSDNVERKWLFSRNSVDDILNELSVKYNAKRKIFEIIRTKTNINYKTVWTDSKYNAKTYGTQLIKDIVGVDFPFPKSLYAVKECIKAAIHPKNAIILDIFAGSGTTLHATLLLNEEDGGSRQCILATNNENNICEEVTYERCKRVIQGYEDSKGQLVQGMLNNNLRYYRNEFVSRNSSIKNKKELTKRATELLCIKEDCYNEITKNVINGIQNWIKFFSNEGGLYFCVIFDDMKIEDSIQIIKKFIDLNKPIDPIKVYVFSNGQYPYTEDFEEVLEHVILCALPDAIYKAYQNVLPKKKRQIIPELEDSNVQSELLSNEDLFSQTN